MGHSETRKIFGEVESIGIEIIEEGQAQHRTA